MLLMGRFMKSYLSANKLVTSFLFMLIFVSGQVLSSQETARSAISLINMNDDRPRAEHVVLGYTEKLDHLVETDGGVSLLLYTDRYVIVYYPAYMKRAGTYGMYLDETVMRHLWSLLTSEITLAFSEEAVLSHIQVLNRAKAAAGAILSRSGDEATTVIEIFPNRYLPAGFGSGDADEMKRVSWHGLKWDASQYPGIQELQVLVMIQQLLQEIMQHADLKSLD